MQKQAKIEKERVIETYFLSLNFSEHITNAEKPKEKAKARPSSNFILKKAF